MKNLPNTLRSIFPFLIISFLIQITPVKGQSKHEVVITNEWAKTPVKIDGDLNDWKDTLSYQNQSTNFSYQIKNNGEKVFLAIKSHNKQNLNRIIARGISFSFNTEGKKNPGETLVFPIFDRVSQTKKPVNISKDEAQKQLLSRITKLFINGFSDIKDGPISLSNTYGISAAAGFDEKDQLVIEMAIPFDQLKITSEASMIFCLIEINGVKQARMPYDPNRNAARRNRYGYPNQDYGFDRGPAIDKQNLATGFWIKSNLAKNPDSL